MSTTKKNRRSQRGTRKNYIHRLKKLYPLCKHDSISDNDSYNGHKITYGEMEYEGIHKLYQFITKNYNSQIDCFIDIGSGRGKLCMYMASQPKIKDVLGVELVTQRHNDAEKLKSELDFEFANKVELINKNIFETNFENYKDNKIFIWFSNLCFDQDGTNAIFNKLQKELPKGTILCCSKEPNPSIGELLNKIKIPMSWIKESNVYIYRL